MAEIDWNSKTFVDGLDKQQSVKEADERISAECLNSMIAARKPTEKESKSINFAETKGIYDCVSKGRAAEEAKVVELKAQQILDNLSNKVTPAVLQGRKEVVIMPVPEWRIGSYHNPLADKVEAGLSQRGFSIKYESLKVDNKAVPHMFAKWER